jgi:hypothetical protein
VIGPGQCAIVPRNRWAEDFSTAKGTEASRVYVEAMLCVRGCFVSEAVGEMVYYKNNDSQNYGDAVEGAKTAALRRCAKELGIGLQAWKKTWCEGWWARRRAGKPAPQPPPANVPQSGTAKRPDAAKSASAALPPPTEAQRLKWIGMLRPLGQAALDYAYEKGWLVGPTEDNAGEPLEVLGLEHVPRSKKEANSILEDIQRWMDGDLGPATSTHPAPENAPESDSERSTVSQDGVETIVGTLEQVSVKSGKSKRGPWTCNWLRVDQTWANTLDKTTGELAVKLKGERVRIGYRAGGKGNELVSFEKATKE